MKVRDETLFGLHCYRSSDGVSFVFQVYIRPLYWPADAGAYGITERIGHWARKEEHLGEGWLYLDRAELADEGASRVAPVINTRIAPFFAQLPDGKAVLRYGLTHPFDPLLGWLKLTRSCRDDLWAYMQAWCGDRRKARASLKSAIADARSDIARLDREKVKLRGNRSPTAKQVAQDQEGLEHRTKTIAHLQQTLSLVDRPEALRALLQETANKNRTEMKLDRAQPVLEVLRRQRRQAEQ